MNLKDDVYIRNIGGLLKIELKKKLCTSDVARGLGIDKLPTMENPRLEFHNNGGSWMVTLTDENSHLPAKIICAFLDYNDVQIFEGQFSKTEQEENIFETVFH